MAVVTLLLLWLFQFIFFDLIYYNRQQSSVNNICEELLGSDYFGSSSSSSWKKLRDTAKVQNFNIYIFSFSPGDILFDEKKDEYTLPAEGEKKVGIYVYTPHYTNDRGNASYDSLNWESERINQVLHSVMGLNEHDSFSYVEETSAPKSNADTMIFGGRIKTEGQSRNYYLCAVATISKGNYTVSIMQGMLLAATVLILILSVILAIIFSRRISGPIDKLATTANQLATGDFSVSFESDSFLEIKQLAASFNFAKDEMSKTEQMRRDFIANVSHDLRTPLTMIKAYAEMIRDLSGNVPEKRNKHCGIIIDETNRLSMLVADIQNLSKLQSGTDSFQIKTFDLSELCLTVIHRFDIMRESQGYVFKSECDPEALVLGDYPKIEQVLYNLIGNALNYTGEDKTITVRCKKVDEGFKVEIIDTGKGIDPQEIDSVWERYYRANQKKRNIVGSGLGLNIVKMILEGHKAKYGVSSELNKGTDFWFILPESKEE